MTSDGEQRTFVIFRLGDESYGLPVDVVTGVVRFEQPTPVPRAPRSVIGVVNLRGRVLPVVDLKSRFGSSEPLLVGPHARILIAEGAAGPVGVIVDAVTEVATFSAEEIRPVPDGVVVPDTEFAFAGMVERGQAIVILLDPHYVTQAGEPDVAQVGVDGSRKEGSHV
jgi:purine-binding chemotaxis protein CheW